MLLFDQNISFRIIRQLSDCFPNSCQVRMLGLENSEDIDIWDYARKNDLTIVTFDADFFEISIMNGCPPKIIWLRTGNLNTNRIADLMKNNRHQIIDFCTHPELKDMACLELY